MTSSALAWAASAGQETVVDMLLEAGADPAHKNPHGLDARALALDNGWHQVARQLEHAVASLGRGRMQRPQPLTHFGR